MVMPVTPHGYAKFAYAGYAGYGEFGYAIYGYSTWLRWFGQILLCTKTSDVVLGETQFVYVHK